MITPPPGPELSGTVVVLLTAAALGGTPDIAALHSTLAAGRQGLRVLLMATEASDLALVDTLAGSKAALQILLAPGLAAPEGAFAVSMPPGSSRVEQEELALALSDVVIAAPTAENADAVRPLLARARALDKPVCPPGCDLRCVPAARATVTFRLDPEIRGWHRLGRRLAGRLEQAFLELLAWRPGTNATTRRRLRKTVSRQWVPGHFFAPDEWQTLAPDAASTLPDSPLARGFERFDRSALYGSYVHRDLIWIAHIAAGFAVLFAVAGSLPDHHSALRRVLELGEFALLLGIAGLIYAARRVRLQDRWTACRLAAEQLRIARMCLPLLVVPPVLNTTSGRGDEPGQDFDSQAVIEMQRAVRDQGLPRLARNYDVAAAARWLRLIVSDQMGYHAANENKLERAEGSLRTITQVFFAASLLAVIVNVLVPADWLLLITAAGPAFAAAMHGAQTRLGIVHRAGLSRDVHRGLARIDRSLAELQAKPPEMADAAWTQLRALARQAADAMGQENQSWHGLVRRERDDLPA